MIGQVQKADVRDDAKLAKDSNLDVCLNGFGKGCSRGI